MPWWRISIVSLAGLAAALSAGSETVERWFSTGWYPVFQRHVTRWSNGVPFAVFDVLAIMAGAGVLAVVVGGCLQAWRQRSWRPAGRAMARLVTGTAAGYLVFLGFWGLNYRRIPLTERLVLADGPLSNDAVLGLAERTVQELNRLHADAHAAGWRARPSDDRALLDAFAAVQPLLSDAPPAAPGRLKRSLFGWYFRWASVDGMVNPFALEVIVNPDLLPFELPFVAAHEWAHLAGYADESEANFVGWITCMRAGVAAQYSAWVYLYWQTSGDWHPSERARLAASLAPGPRGDIAAVVERVRRGQRPWLRKAGWLAYDHYLRVNRVEGGIRSYNDLLSLILRVRFEDEWTPVRRARGASLPGSDL